MANNDYALNEILACARRLTTYKNSNEDIKAEIETLRCALKVYDAKKEVSKCDTCPDSRNCFPGEEPCGSYELPESEVVKIYNGERFI